MTGVYFDQLSGAAHTWKLVNTFSQPFTTFFFLNVFNEFPSEITKKTFMWDTFFKLKCVADQKAKS